MTMNHETEIFGKKQNLMKDSFVKNNYLISNGILLISQLNYNPHCEGEKRERKRVSLLSEA